MLNVWFSVNKLQSIYHFVRKKITLLKQSGIMQGNLSTINWVQFSCWHYMDWLGQIPSLLCFVDPDASNSHAIGITSAALPLKAMVSFISCTLDFEPNISEKMCSFYSNSFFFIESKDWYLSLALWIIFSPLEHLENGNFIYACDIIVTFL